MVAAAVVQKLEVAPDLNGYPHDLSMMSTKTIL